jgi:hypothetical protein
MSQARRAPAAAAKDGEARSMTRKGGGGDGQQPPREVASYIAALTGELGQMAHRHRMDGLAYILAIARIEAEQIADGPADGRVA